jgi:hypothetical protein
MRSRARFAGLVLAGAFALSCSDHGAVPPPAEQATLGGEVAARVGTDAIPVGLVAKVAVAQKITPREALRRLVDDAVSASAARARGLDRQPPTSWLLTAARGRMTADHILAEARQSGPASDAEIDELTRQYWREVDRPLTLRVVHVVVRTPEKPDPALEKQSRDLAEQIHAAVATARDADDFIAKANAVPHPNTLVVVAQPLPAFADDGYTSEGEENRMAEAFTKAAFTLTTPGATTDVVESQFGWHVIRLVERIPEQRMGLEARRLAFADEVVMKRARVATDARLKSLRAAAPIEISPSAENLMRSLQGTQRTAEREPPQ